MPISIIELDSSAKEENVTLILGKNILLKIIEEPEKQRLLKDDKVKKFTSIPNLCHDEIRLLIEEIVQKPKIPSVPLFARTSEGEDITVMDTTNTATRDESLDKTISEVETQIRSTYDKTFKTILSDLFLTFLGKVDKKVIQEEDKKKVSMGAKLKSKTNFEILVPLTLLLCPTCEILLSTGEFSGSKKCYGCKKEIKREDAERIYVHKACDEVEKVWEKNLWFEAYIARLLRKLGCKTWAGVHVMGASGILHEVDVLAIRNGTVLTAECKTGKVSRNDVFNFCTKVGDLKAHVSILALIKELPESETREFVKKNPAIIRLENMGKMYETDILGELERRLSIKS